MEPPFWLPVRQCGRPVLNVRKINGLCSYRIIFAGQKEAIILEESYIFVGYALETVLKMFCGSGVEKGALRPMSWNYVNLFELFLCDTGSGERKIRFQTRGLKLCQPFWTVKSGKRVQEKKNTLPDPPKEENRVQECENKQLDPENENYVNYFG